MRHTVILAGGVGARFWPVSRPDRPKQLLPLVDDRSLLRTTFDRLAPLVPAERTWVVTSASLLHQVRRELPEVPSRQVLGEPRGRNTAPAILLAARVIGLRDPNATMLVVPADAWIPRAAVYRRTARIAMRAAERSDTLVLVGVKPTRIETGYGYIEPGEGGGESRPVRRFVEKPDRARARRMVAGGKHLWNCGIFAWRTEVYEEAVKQHLPRLARAFRPLTGRRISRQQVEAVYSRSPSISVDHGVLEPASNRSVVPASFLWDDLGSWSALAALGRGDEYRRGSVVALDSPGLIAWAESGTVATVGVENLVVVHTPDATLVAARDRAQDVRELVARVDRLRARSESKKK